MKCCKSLTLELVAAPLVAGRIMQRHDALDLRLARQRARLMGGQMAPGGRDLRIYLEKGRLYEEHLGFPGEGDDLLHVRRREGCVHNIGNLVPRRDLKDFSPELAEREGPRRPRARLSPFDG